ncbi:NYN domain-containing protein [Catenulispora subtropica]|uniref:NYN domain-containing protein n=1 Tax=Catenulispora subtropica TaxID=450798 RepID=A0ABP5D5T2_9ACTN
MSAAEGGERLTIVLPDSVRQRVVEIASEALGRMPAAEVPVPLKPFAKFAPAKRAKAAAIPMAAALESDGAFRARVAERVRDASPDLSESLFAGVVPAAADPHEIAAVAYVLRPHGWTGIVKDALEAVSQGARTAAGEAAEGEVARLNAEVAELRETARQAADALRAAQEEARREGDQLRRKVRQLEADMRRAQAAARAGAATLEAERSAARAAASAAEAEVRRLRTRLTAAETALDTARRSARSGRSEGDMRLRLLLDTLAGSVKGLERELALPPTQARPADSVTASEPDTVAPADMSMQGRAKDDPALLDQLLTLPMVHLVVDGYNVTKTGYPTLSLAEQRVRLVGGLAALAARTGAEVTCVFDGAALDGPVRLTQPRGVRVLFSAPGEIADELIRRLVAAEPAGRPVVVVSSDREVAEGVRRSGARPVPASMLLNRMARS